MFGAIARKMFGTANDRYVRGLRKIVDAINALEPDVARLSDADLAARTPMLRDRLAAGETLDDLLPDAFATVREAARRVLGERPFDVQLMGGIVQHRGMISEMKTGEGKTLVATLSVYLNALAGAGVHVVTVNDYLARRDADWMGRVYHFLGLSVGCIVHGLTDAERRVAYAADVTYGTNNELGFDYLRDNMKFRHDDLVQRPFNFAIVDEVDSILIDEARTPLIISGPTEDNSDLYVRIDALIPGLGDEDFEKDEKARSITFTEAGTERIETLMRESGVLTEGNMYDIQNISLVHHANQALRAHKLFTRDVDYVVKDNKVVIIDEFTGRMMEGRRYSDGLHQALEAKESVTIQNENQTLASITFQNYFRLYPKLAGMTGTAMTEAGEFAEIYGLEVIEIPTNVAVGRVDQDDEVYRTAEEKNAAIVDLIEDCHKRGQPALVGTVSIEKSELLAGLLAKRKVPHNVLNAKNHGREALYIAQAGAPGAVTIATNMAGRGTDIKLGGNVDMRIATELNDLDPDSDAFGEKRDAIVAEVAANKQTVIDAGGLFVIGTERHESRRIDNQLRGRSGRQGDPGESKFYLSLQDDLMRIFGSDRMDGMLRKLGLQEGEAIVHPWINKALEKAQQKVEARNFEIRKNLLKFDDVMNDQRKVVYEQRRELMAARDVAEMVRDMRHHVIEDIVARHVPAKAFAEQWDMDGLHADILRLFGLDLPLRDWAREDGIAEAEIRDRLLQATDAKAAEKVANYGPEIMRDVEKGVVLQVLDTVWKDHLLTLDHLRQGIGLRAYGQRDPLNEYKREAFTLFEDMLATLRERAVHLLMHVELQLAPGEAFFMDATERETHETRIDPALGYQQATGLLDGGEAAAPAATGPTPIRSRQAADDIDPNDPTTWGKISRNAPCPCGSGKKYKHCHGASA